MAELILIFLRFGCLGFGGPFALIAMMEEELVTRRQWLSPEKFNQAFAMIKVLPGATATQLAIYIARERKGRIGGFVAGVAFILPSALFVLLLSIFYVSARKVPQISSLFQGMQIGALLIIADSVIRMARPYVKSSRAAIISIISGAVIFIRPSLEPLLILSFGMAGIMGASGFNLSAFWATTGSLKMQLVRSTQFKLTMICLKAGFLVFGTGLAIIPVLEADVVGKYHWLTHGEFLDGLAIGQITPGPVSTTATFIGYKVGGVPLAIWATAAIFASAFFNMLFLLPLVESRLKSSPKLKMFTDWAFPSVIGGIVATSLRLGMSTVDSWLIAVCSFVLALLAIRLRPPAWALIPLSGFTVFAVSRLF